MKDSLLKQKSYSFALQIILTCRQMNEVKKFVLSRQLLRSGTAIGALIEEAGQAESKADFIHKLSIANKEANETRYWLRLLKDSEILSAQTAENLVESCSELIRMLVSAIKTTKQNLSKL